MNPIEHIDEQHFAPVSENTMPNISRQNQFDTIHAEQNYNQAMYHRDTLLHFENNVKPDCVSQANAMNHAYGDGLSLSEASVCSSMDIRTPDLHPVYNNGSIIQSEMVGQIVATTASFGDQLTSPTTQHWHQYQDPGRIWPMATDTTSAGLSYPPSINSEENDESCSNSCLSEIEEKMMLYSDSPHLEDEEEDDIDQQEAEEGLSSSSKRKSPNNRRNTVSSFPCTEEWCDPTEKELRRQSMNSFLIQTSLKKESQLDDSNTSFCHLSREELIQRVVELEREKQLNSKLLGVNAASSDKERGPNSLEPMAAAAAAAAQTTEGSDEDEIHPCLWSHCNTSATSLDQLIVHIKDSHIGSGKAAYICEWASCARERKPFLKRHKMQNHMRTHTGERPFKCHVEDCDKRFSRPDSLNTHVKTHSSIRPYACLYENCSKAYFHSRSLRKHTKSHESAAVVAAAVAVATASASASTASASVSASVPVKATCEATAPAEAKEEEVIVQRQHPYDRSLKPPRYYRQQVCCGTEARQQTPSNVLINSANFTPMMINTAVLQQQIQTQPSSGFFDNAKMMDICEQEQQQQVFAAGTAYTNDMNAYNPEIVEKQLLQHHQRLQEQQQQQLFFQQQQQQQQQISYQQQHFHQQAYVSYNNQPLSVQLDVQQQLPQYHGYNYSIY